MVRMWCKTHVLHHPISKNGNELGSGWVSLCSNPTRGPTSLPEPGLFNKRVFFFAGPKSTSLGPTQLDHFKAQS